MPPRERTTLWAAVLCLIVRHTPWLTPLIRVISIRVAWWGWPRLRRDLQTNARRLLGTDSTRRQRVRFAKNVIARFFDFIATVADDASPEALRARVVATEGADRYLALRARRGGVVLVTAHLGAFEPGLAAVVQVEKRVLVMFRRDSIRLFDRARSNLRTRMGVEEVHVDAGLPAWLRVRDALRDHDAAVLIQGDRTMSGQPGELIPFMDGHIRIPTGPVKLARAAECPLVPVFATFETRHLVRIHLEEPIDTSDVRVALGHYARILERFVRRYPDQWLMALPAWAEDQEA